MTTDALTRHIAINLGEAIAEIKAALAIDPDVTANDYGITPTSPTALDLGDVIMEHDGRSWKRTATVETIHVNPPGCNGHTHVNKRSCYDNVATVHIKARG